MINNFYLGMDAKVVNIIKDKVALEWKMFARGTGFDGVDAYDKSS